MDSNPYRSRLNGLDWSATPIQSSHSIANTGRRNDELRENWHASMLNVTAEQLVFVVETAFNEMTGWRMRAYAPIGQPARYQGDIRRGLSGLGCGSAKSNGSFRPKLRR